MATLFNYIQTRETECESPFFSDIEYTISSVKSSCCISEKKGNGDNKFHERCVCRTTDVAICKENCDQDANCKGYVDKGDGDCHMATTSDCPSGCSKGVEGNVGAIDPQGNCGIDSYMGCHIKGNSICNV